MFCICIEVYQLHEGDDYDEINEIISALENKNLKINNIFVEKHKEMLENPDFEQDCYSRTAEGINKTGHDNISLMKWMAQYDRSYYENIIYYDLIGSVLKSLNEVS